MAMISVTCESCAICRAKAKRAILSLKERGFVDIFYAQHPHDREYGPNRMFVELRGQ